MIGRYSAGKERRPDVRASERHGRPVGEVNRCQSYLALFLRTIEQSSGPDSQVRGRSALFRFLLVLLIMMDTFRRIIDSATHDARPIDLWMTGIEIFVLLFIVLDFAWHSVDRFRRWRAAKKSARQLADRLATLSASDADAFASFILDRKDLPGDVARSLEKIPSLVEPDFSRGYRLVAEHKAALIEWATTRKKSG